MGATSAPAGSPADHIGYRIKMLRLSRQLPQKAVAKVVGMDPTHLSKIENGDIHDPGFSTIERIVVRGLGAELADLQKGEHY